MGTTTFSGPVVSPAGFTGDIGGTSTLTAGAGITAGVGTVYQTEITKVGKVVSTDIFIDLTGLNSSANNDIIGVSPAAASCHIGQIDFTVSGVIFEGWMACIETPLTGEPDIKLFSATVGTGAEDTAITALVETSLLEGSIDWTLGVSLPLDANMLLNDEFLYLVGDGAGTDATYTAGQFFITLKGYLA